jgi:small subunit ribosomal protein S8
MMTDPISDLLARIRNAHLVAHNQVSAPASKMKERIADLLQREGYIAGYEVHGEVPHKRITLDLKYDSNNRPMIEGMKRVSRPGLRVYKPARDLPEVRGGVGLAVVSTSHGVMTDHEARTKNVGGEVLCYVW